MRHLIRSIVLAVACVAVASCAQRHDATGLVLAIDATTSTVTVSHDPIEGFMDAMVMPFTAADAGELRDVRPGDRIGFRLVIRGGETRIDRIRILTAAPADSGLLVSPVARALVPIGAPVPDFTLTDHNGQAVSLGSLRGKVVVVAFIYTRCPLPDYCPRVITNQSALRNRFAARMDTELVLLTVTFDPKHDTPEKLKAYAASYGADVPGWHFLTGAAGDVGRVCALFGVEFWPEEGLITHTLQAAVVGRDGALRAAAGGKDYTPRQLGDLVALALDARH